MGKLDGKCAIVTGASSGVGRATAYELAKEGCNLVLTARRTERLEEICAKCKEMGVNAVYYAGDVREEKTAKETVQLAVSTFGKIDILINNAGIGKAISLVDSTLEDYQEIMDTNVQSAFLFTHEVIPYMLEVQKGLVVFVSSVTGCYGHVNEFIYTASKFALRGMAQALDKELYDKGIKSTVMCPSAIETEFEVGHGRDASKLPAKKFLQAEEVAEAIVFACTRSDNHRLHEVRFASMTCPSFA